MVVCLQPVQLHQRAGAHIAARLEHIDLRLLRVAVHQPQLELRGELARVHLADERVPVRVQHIVGPLGGGKRVRRAAGVRPQRALGRRAGNHAQVACAEAVKLRDRAVAHVEHGIGDAARLRRLQHGLRRELGVAVKVLGALVERVQRGKRDSLRLEPGGQAAAPRVQHHGIRAAQRVRGLKRQLFAAMAASDHDDLRHGVSSCAIS